MKDVTTTQHFNISESYRSPILFAAVLQVSLLLLASLIVDDGTIFTVTMVASLSFWISAMLIIVRRSSNPTRTDLAYIRYGLLLNALLSSFGRALQD